MNKKIWLMILAMLALAALFMLASSMNNVHFEPGRQPAPRATLIPDKISFLRFDNVPATPLWKLVLVWVGFLLCFILFIYLLPPEARKQVLLQMVRFALAAIAIYFALRNHTIDLPNQNGGPPAQSVNPFFGVPPSANTPVFQPPAITPWMSYFISLGVTLVLLILAFAAYRFWKRFGNRESTSLETIADIARASLHEIAAGQEFSDVIIHSYVRMSEAVSQRRGLKRKEAMTSREFATRLERAGLPADAVKRLTRLFESVRYGARKSSQADVNEAVECLHSILHACGVPQA